MPQKLSQAQSNSLEIAVYGGLYGTLSTGGKEPAADVWRCFPRVVKRTLMLDSLTTDQKQKLRVEGAGRNRPLRMVNIIQESVLSLSWIGIKPIFHVSLFRNACLLVLVADVVMLLPVAPLAPLPLHYMCVGPSLICNYAS